MIISLRHCKKTGITFFCVDNFYLCYNISVSFHYFNPLGQQKTVNSIYLMQFRQFCIHSDKFDMFLFLYVCDLLNLNIPVECVSLASHMLSCKAHTSVTRNTTIGSFIKRKLVRKRIDGWMISKCCNGTILLFFLRFIWFRGKQFYYNTKYLYKPSGRFIAI